MGKENPPANVMTLDDLVAEFGRPIPDTVFAEYLGINVRALRRNADKWGGVEVARGHIMFFEFRVKEVLNAKPTPQKRDEAMVWGCDGQRPALQSLVPGRLKGQRKSRGSMGSGREGPPQKSAGRRSDDPLGFLDGPPSGD